MDSQASSKALKSRRWTKSNGLFPLGLGQGHAQKASRKITFSEQGLLGSREGPPFPLGFYIKPKEQPPSKAQTPLAPVWGDQSGSNPTSHHPVVGNPPVLKHLGKEASTQLCEGLMTESPWGALLILAYGHLLTRSYMANLGHSKKWPWAELPTATLLWWSQF